MNGEDRPVTEWLQILALETADERRRSLNPLRRAFLRGRQETLNSARELVIAGSRARDERIITELKKLLPRRSDTASAQRQREITEYVIRLLKEWTV